MVKRTATLEAPNGRALQIGDPYCGRVSVTPLEAVDYRSGFSQPLPHGWYLAIRPRAGAGPRQVLHGVGRVGGCWRRSPRPGERHGVTVGSGRLGRECLVAGSFAASSNPGIVRFSELVALLEKHGFRLVREKGSIRYYARDDWPNVVRVDYHGAREVPGGTCSGILKAAGLKRGR